MWQNVDLKSVKKCPPTCQLENIHRSLCAADGNEARGAPAVWQFAGLSHLILSQQPVPSRTENSEGDRRQTESRGLLKTQ